MLNTEPSAREGRRLPETFERLTARQRALLVAVLSAVSIMYTMPIGTRPLWNQDEARVLLLAEDTLRHGLRLPARVRDAPYLNKPPLFFWTVALGAWPTGRVSDREAPIPSITSFADFFDLQNFPGKRGVYNYVSGGLPEIALVADGVAPDALYPLDMDRAYKKMDTIKDQMVWWDTGAQSAQLLADGEVSMGMSWNGRLSEANEGGREHRDHVGPAHPHRRLPDGHEGLEERRRGGEPARRLDGLGRQQRRDQQVHQLRADEHRCGPKVSRGRRDRSLPSTLPAIPPFGFDDVWWGENYSKVNPDWQSWVQG